jgi:O-antigen ligase
MIGGISGFILLAFAFFRPLSLAFSEVSVGPLNILELFAIAITYPLVLILIARSARIQIESTSILIFFYCCYCLLSFLWGSHFRETIRMIIPFVMYFVAIACIEDIKQLRLITKGFVLGFVYPIIGSVIYIFLGLDKVFLVYQTGVVKSQGVFSSNHPFGHAMFFFSFIYAFAYAIGIAKSCFWKYLLNALLLMSIFCLYKGGARTTLMGFIVFWVIYLWHYRKMYLAIFLAGMLLVAAYNMEKVNSLVFQQREATAPHDLNASSSGRMSLWGHNLKILEDSNIEKVLIGFGIGVEGKPVVGSNVFIVAAHNDYLSLIVTLGILGLINYLSIYLSLIWNIAFSLLGKRLRGMFIGLLLAAMIMNFVSNSYLLRVELAQMLWFFSGVFMLLRKWSAVETDTKGNPCPDLLDRS